MKLASSAILYYIVRMFMIEIVPIKDYDKGKKFSRSRIKVSWNILWYPEAWQWRHHRARLYDVFYILRGNGVWRITLLYQRHQRFGEYLKDVLERYVLRGV